MAALPPVDAVRPARCPFCDAASRPVGGRVALVGHGLRQRRLWGPPSVDGAPEDLELVLRRYRCRCCGAVIAVGPASVVPGRLYSATAIALAFALYGIEHASHPQVRRRVSPWRPSRRDPARTLWVTLIRWVEARRAGVLFGHLRSPPSMSRRLLAAHTAVALGALAITTASSPIQRAWAAAARAR